MTGHTLLLLTLNLRLGCYPQCLRPFHLRIHHQLQSLSHLPPSRLSSLKSILNSESVIQSINAHRNLAAVEPRLPDQIQLLRRLWMPHRHLTSMMVLMISYRRFLPLSGRKMRGGNAQPQKRRGINPSLMAHPQSGRSRTLLWTKMIS